MAALAVGPERSGSGWHSYIKERAGSIFRAKII